MSTKQTVGRKLIAPIVAAGTSAAASYIVKKGPGFVEDTLLPRLREAANGAGGVKDKLPDKLPEKARSVVSSGGELAEQLTDRARDVTGLGGDSGESRGGGSNGALSKEDLSRRSEERAQRRAKRRKATK